MLEPPQVAPWTPARAKWLPSLGLRWRVVAATAAGALNIGLGAVSVAVAATYSDRCYHQPHLPIGLALHGVAQVVAVFGLALHADLKAHLQHNLHKARLRQRSRKKNKRSCLYRKEQWVYKSLSVENLRVKTFGLIPDERAVAGKQKAWWCIVAQIFAGLSVSLLPPLTTLGTVDIYALQSRASLPSCHPALLTFCQIIYTAYDILYLAVFLVWFCCTSCEPIVRGHANLPAAPHPTLRLSPEFEESCKHSPGWAWLCWLRGGVSLIYMFLGLPMLEIGIIYLGLCSPHLAVPGWLLGQGAVTVVCLMTFIPAYLLPQHLGTRTVTSLHFTSLFLVVVVVVWPSLGLLPVLAGWKERRDIIISTSGYCDPEFQLFTVVVAATLNLPMISLLYAAGLLIIAVVIVGAGTLLFWGCCDEGISSDVGIVTHTYTKGPLSSALFEAQMNGGGTGVEGDGWPEQE